MADIDAQTVKELRSMTGAGFMECKKALTECNGNLQEAAEYLRKRGVETAGKKAGRATKEGWIGHYIHANGKIGVLVEVNCETDFVAKNDQFQELIRDIAMHIAAMNPASLSSEDLDPQLVEKEREILRESDEIKSKPAEIQDKIIDGKLGRYFSEVCLLEQSFVKDDKKTVGELMTEKIATIGENMSIRRFIRYEVGGE